MTGKSKGDLDAFLDFLGQKGLAPKSTVSARKASANKVLSVLDDDELENVFDLDMDEVAQRFANLEGQNYTPDSLKSYVSRARVAVEDFRRYTESPMTFKVKSPGNSFKAVAQGKRTMPVVVPRPERERQKPSQTPSPMENSVLPIPIRSDVVVQIHGIPFDLTEAEANKLANVIKALAM